jgi:hypothetical protein
MKTISHSLFLTIALLLAATGATAAEEFGKVKNGGILGNQYSSTLARVDDATMRITTRKKMNGDLEEVNKPGTTMYNSLMAVQQAAAVRAAVEAKALGYKVVEVLGSRDLTTQNEVRAASKGETPVTGFTFAPGVYHNDVELAIEVVIKCVPGEMPSENNGKYLDVIRILKQYNIEE